MGYCGRLPDRQGTAVFIYRFKPCFMGNYLFWAWFILIVGYYVYLAYKRIIAHYDERIKQAKQELEREQRIYEATLKKIENREALLKNMTSEAPGGKITSASLYDDKIHFFTKN